MGSIESESNFFQANQEQRQPQGITRRVLLQSVSEKIQSRLQQVDGNGFYDNFLYRSKDRKLTRRGLFAFGLMKGAEAIIVYESIGIFSGIQSSELVNSQIENHKENLEIAERDPEKLQVKSFAHEIIRTSNIVSENTPKFDKVKTLAIATSVNAFISFLHRNKTNFFNRMASVAFFQAGSLVDGLSTLEFTRYMQDPRFKEYGFDGIASEASLVLPDNPTQMDVNRAYTAKTLIMTPFTFIAYPLGRIYLGLSHETREHNLRLAYTLRTGLEYGDKVKGLIANGAGEEDVRRYLNLEVENFLNQKAEE